MVSIYRVLPIEVIGRSDESASERFGRLPRAFLSAKLYGRNVSIGVCLEGVVGEARMGWVGGRPVGEDSVDTPRQAKLY